AAAMSGLGAGSAPAWVPTHVQVTVLRARGLRAKAAAGGGGSDAYTVMALGRDKFSTSVAERCQGQPLWREEATFELPPPPRPAALRLTVLHRALVGLDKFLGRAEVDLAALRADGGRRHTRWYKLRSKPGKKEKERGEIEVDIQFMRSNMTASMFDLSAKDKSRSAFGKLKDRLKGKRGSGFSDTASAIVPSSAHSSGDSDEEAAEKEKKKSKLKSLFSKPGLQKNSLSQSMSVLPTQQPVTQRVLLRPSDFQSQWDNEESETSPASDRKSSPSPVLKSRRTATLDRPLNQVATNHPRKEGLSLFSGLKSKTDPVSKSSLCINGSHVYMEESRTKDSTPASSPSPRNFRRKQLFASEENLSSRSAKAPEEAGRTSPSHAFSGSASLETFKSMTLPSYKLLSSEEHLEPSVPLSVEVIKETKKTDHRKSALLSLVTGKKDGVKSSDAENIPDRTLQDEANKVPEEKSEQETKDVELAADGSRGSPSGDSHHAEDVCAKKQPLNPFEEEQRPEKSAPTKTKAVKPRLGLPAEEETKATLPTLAPESLPAFPSGHSVRSGNNPFVPKTGQKGQGPDPGSRPGAAASLTSPPALAAELFSGKNPFTPAWGRAPSALLPEGGAHFPSAQHLSPPVLKAPPPGQVSGSTNNPFASGWGQSSGGQGPAPQGVPASVPCKCHFNDNNPFVSKLGWEADVPGFKAVATSPPLCLAGGEGCSPEHPAELEHSGRGAAGSNADVALTGGDVKAAPNPLGTPPDSPALAPEKKCSSSLSPGIGVKQLPSPERGLEEEQEIFGGKRGEDYAPRETPLDKDDSFSPAAPPRPALGACVLSPQQAEVGRAGSEVPKPAPRLSVTLKCLPGSQAAELSAAVPSSGRGVEPAAGLPLPNGKASGAAECLPQGSSWVTGTAAVVLRDHSSDRHSKTEGEDEVVDCPPKLRSAVPLAGECALKLLTLPVILEGGSDDELLGDCQGTPGLAGGEKNLPETGKQSLGAVPLPEDLQEHCSSSAAAQITPADLGGRGGSAAGACEPSRAPELPARAGVDSAKRQVADSGLGVMSHSREQDTPLEEQELNRSAGAEQDFSEPSVSSSSLSSPPQSCFSSHPLPSDTPNHRAESPKKPTAEGCADKAGDCGKKKLLQAWVSPSDICPNLSQQSGETSAAKHRLHPVKPMNATANKPQSKTLNVISTMNEKLLEMNMKKYEPSDPAYAYAQLTHDELIQLVLKQKDTITRKDVQVRELE
ncbi:RFIP1 protein, partial [Tricholaema leucomelas]|nr:RFIP1 protein [Tricholaema leucomelas]